MSEFIDQWPNNDNSYGHGIISKNCVARILSDVDSKVRAVFKGTFIEVHSVREKDVVFCVVRDDMQVETDHLLCQRGDIIYVPENLWGPLFTVEQHARLPLVEDTKVAENMGNISVGHTVQVLGPDNKTVCTGTVTFRNSIRKLGVGVYFGLKILASEDSLQSIISNVSLLEPQTKGFPRGCDIVVSVDKIRPMNLNCNSDRTMYHCDKENQKQPVLNSNYNDSKNISYKSTVVLNLNDKSSNQYNQSNNVNTDCSSIVKGCNLSLIKTENADNPLVVGDKVVFLIGEAPETGVVRWMGLYKNSLRVGVEFDNPIGCGTGVLEGIEFFKAKNNHALFVNPMELIKLSDYMTNNTKETHHYKNNNTNNNNYNNNINIYNNLRSNDCCDNKQTYEEKQKIVKSNSHQYLKHPDKLFYYDDMFQTNNDIYKEKHSFAGDRFNSENGFEGQTQYVSKSFDYMKHNERKTNYRKNQNSIDSDQSDLKVYSSNILGPKTPSQDLYDLFGQSWPKLSKNMKSSEELYKTLIEEPSYCKALQNVRADEHYKVNNEKDIWNLQYSEHSSSSNESLTNYYDTPKPITSFLSKDLGKGSLVELTYKGKPQYGVIRWIGKIPECIDTGSSHCIAGIEMEEEGSDFTDGTFNNKRYFQCNPQKALFVPLIKCRKDSRFSEETLRPSIQSKINYGQIDCPIVEGIIPPIHTKEDIQSICGKNRGIQGHHNSCYLDATLFSMFAFTCVFDSLLYRPQTKNDIPQYGEVQRVLREEIVNPLRKNLYVRADRVMKLRTLLEKLSSVSGLTSEEKDPEEFLNSLLAQILKAEPFLKLNSGQEAFHYQLFVEKDEKLTFPSVQQLFEQSFVTSDIKLKQVPPCLIIQMPRFGKSFKMYSKILPPQLLDITDVIENSPRQCAVCGKSAEFECKECFGQNGIGNGLEGISFCRGCLETVHNHHSRTKHNYRALTVPVEFSLLQDHCMIPRVYMELFAVVCIETSHYVAFVKCGSGSDAPWCFFDSMADRKGEQNGYNIPEMVPCPDLPYWLSEDGAKMLNEMKDERQLPEHAKRLFSDAYMCMYQSPDMMMYR